MRKKIITKDEVLDIAEKLVQEKGLASCTMRNIAVEAGIAVGTLYNYYDSQKGLFEDLFKMSWQKTENRLAQIPESQVEPKIKLTTIIDIITEDINSRQGLGRELLQSEDQLSKTMSVYASIRNSIIDIICRVLRESERNKDLENEVLKQLGTWVLVIIMNGIISGEPLNHQSSQILNERFL